MKFTTGFLPPVDFVLKQALDLYTAEGDMFRKVVSDILDQFDQDKQALAAIDECVSLKIQHPDPYTPGDIPDGISHFSSHVVRALQKAGDENALTSYLLVAPVPMTFGTGAAPSDESLDKLRLVVVGNLLITPMYELGRVVHASKMDDPLLFDHREKIRMHHIAVIEGSCVVFRVLFTDDTVESEKLGELLMESQPGWVVKLAPQTTLH